ncbi:helix-turn-helix domain-containing protein [Undibacterium danionis]|uniref:Helix-turn-helix domain-containing protein n=1 Tax=Undibacterium danionis TaxID=1812100 RepID=A0ABV6IIW2_9BURK
MQSDFSIGSTALQRWLNEINLGAKPSMILPSLPQSRVSLLRWQIDHYSSKIHKASPLDSEYRVSLLLAPLTASIWKNGQLDWTGELASGSFRICAPGSASEWSQNSSCDIVNLFLPKQLINALCEAHAQEASSLGVKIQGKITSTLQTQKALKNSERFVKLPDTGYRQDRFVLHTIEQLLHAQSLRSKLARLSCDYLAFSLATYLVANYSEVGSFPSVKSGRISRNYVRLQTALDFLEQNLNEELTLSQLAACSNMSTSHFVREFSACFGETPHRYILRKRLDIARKRLIETQIPITELAMELGFHDASHLSRAFNRQFGSAPSEFRRVYTAK